MAAIIAGLTAQAKKALLDQLVDTLKTVEENKRSFASQANDFDGWYTRTIHEVDERFPTLQGAQIGETVETVNAYKIVLDASDQEITSSMDSTTQSLQAITDALVAADADISDNKYTVHDHGLVSINEKVNTMKQGLESRQKAFEEAKARILGIGALQRAWAQEAQEFVEYIASEKQAISEITGDIGERLEAVRARYEGGVKFAQGFEELEKKANDIIAAGNNPHTDLTCKKINQNHYKPFTSFVELLIDNLEEQKSAMDTYLEKCAALAKEIREVTPQFTEYTFDNTLAGVDKMIQDYRVFRADKKPTMFRALTEVNTLRKILDSNMAAIGCPPFEPPAGSDAAQIDTLWAQLISDSEAYEAAILAENKRQLALKNLVEQFKFEAREMTEWLDVREAFIADESHSQLKSQTQARMAKAQMEMFEAEYEERKTDLAQMVDLGTQISNENYSEFAEIEQIYGDLTTRWSALKGTPGEKPLPKPKGN